MRRIIITCFVAGLLAGLLASTSRADAAITCPQEHLGLAVYDIADQTVGPTSWSATCNGAMWYINFTLEYEVNGQWNPANCVNTQPCYIRRPTSGYYSAGSSHSGGVTFAPRNGCDLRFRVRMTLVGKGGNGFSFVSNPTVVC
jgi:hypothetical protein